MKRYEMILFTSIIVLIIVTIFFCYSFLTNSLHNLLLLGPIFLIYFVLELLFYTFLEIPKNSCAKNKK